MKSTLTMTPITRQSELNNLVAREVVGEKGQAIYADYLSWSLSKQVIDKVLSEIENPCFSLDLIGQLWLATFHDINTTHLLGEGLHEDPSIAVAMAALQVKGIEIVWNKEGK